MNYINFLKSFFYLFLVLIFETNFYSFAIEEQELKQPQWKSSTEKTILRGGVQEDVKEQTLTGIGVIGLRFIHKTGFPSYVEEVYSNSPASRVGLKPKDLIFAIDGIRTDQLSSDSVYGLLSGEPGTKVKIFITRGTSMFNVDLTREDLANFSSEMQKRYLSGPIAVPINPQDLFPDLYH